MTRRLLPGAPVLFVLALFGCGRSSRRAPPAVAVVPAREAAKLEAFLPAHLGVFASTEPAWSSGTMPGPRIEASRRYRSADGRTATVRLSTGDVRGALATLDSDAEHAFGSDTPTYWRTTSIAGHRARVAEERPTPQRSECLVRVGPNHVAKVTVAPVAAPGDCIAVAAARDFGRIAASGGVPSPTAGRR
jgi:hypothetical protein